MSEQAETRKEPFDLGGWTMEQYLDGMAELGRIIRENGLAFPHEIKPSRKWDDDIFCFACFIGFSGIGFGIVLTIKTCFF